jgi:AraC-like DNA-binding protein
MPRKLSTVIRHGRYHADAPLRCGDQVIASSSTQYGLTPQYALVYLSSGRAVYSDRTHRAVTIGTGDAFQRLPERVHEVSYSPGTMLHFLAVPSAVFRLMKMMDLRTLDHPLLRLGTRHHFLTRHGQLTRELRESPPQRLIVCLTHMQQLLVDMHIHAALREVSPGAARRIEEACLLLASNLSEPVSVPDVAAKVGLGYSNFRRMFKSSTGVSPAEYRVRRRIERAQELLMEGLSAKAISANLGYSDLFAFSAQFKKFTGLSPRQYCKNLV